MSNSRSDCQKVAEPGSDSEQSLIPVLPHHATPSGFPATTPQRKPKECRNTNTKSKAKQTKPKQNQKNPPCSISRCTMSFWHDGSRAFHWSNVLIRASFRSLSEGLPRMLGVRENQTGVQDSPQQDSRDDGNQTEEKLVGWGGSQRRKSS